jgi:hypothetical protein
MPSSFSTKTIYHFILSQIEFQSLLKTEGIIISLVGMRTGWQVDSEAIRRRVDRHFQKYECDLKVAFFSRSMPVHLRSMVAGGLGLRRRWDRMLLAGGNAACFRITLPDLYKINSPQ